MKLGGWWRLWLALTMVYGAAIAVSTAMSWPDTPQIAHHPSFTYRMSEPAIAVLNRPAPKSMVEVELAFVNADKKGATEEAQKLADEIRDRRARPWSADPIVLEMPNGHSFNVAGDTKENDSRLVAREYVRVLQSEASGQRNKLLVNALLIWLAPAVAVCILGILARWVYLGFKQRTL